MAECGIDVPNWDDFVKNEEVFNTYPALCLPFLARMLEVNIEVLQYPDTEIVNFFCGQSDEDVTIKLCSYGNKFAHLVPINLGKYECYLNVIRKKVKIIRNIHTTYMHFKI